MFASNFLIFGLLIFSTTLSNGIRIVELPPEADSVEIVAGYQTGATSPLVPSAAARALALNSYAAGGNFEFLNEIDRTGFRLRIPQWALPMVLKDIAAYFGQIPETAQRAPEFQDDFRAKVEAEIRNALLGSESDSPDFSTERAFVMISSSVSDELKQDLDSIPKRTSTKTDAASRRLSAERTFRFKPDEPVGGVIFASPVPGVYYREWYSVLLLDRLIQRVLPVKVSTSLPLTLRQYYYRLETPVPAGQFPEPIEETLLQEIQRLQFTRARPEDLEAAKAETRQYLESRYARDWFASLGIPERLEEGLQWIQSMTADDLRGTARDMLVSNRVLATWEPKVKQATVQVESLTDSRAEPSANASSLLETEIKAISAAPFPSHSHAAFPGALVERLASGVSVVASSGYAVFVSGTGLTRFDKEPDRAAMKKFEIHRAARILVLAPIGSLDRIREIWSEFRGGDRDGNVVVPQGNVSSGDLPALFVLKTIVDRKLIEAGWWNDVALRIDASEGSTLQIKAGPEKQPRIIEWIKQIAEKEISDEDFAWARETSLHRFSEVQLDLQSLTWQRDPLGLVQAPDTVSATHVRDVARIYF